MTGYNYKGKTSGMKKIRNNFLYKSYLKLPLWGKIGLPAVALILGMMLVNTIMSTFKIALGLAVVGGLIYLVSSAWMLFEKQKKKSGRL